MPLDDYAEDTFTFDGKERRVFRRGEGPAVIVIAEMPGITPNVVAFADEEGARSFGGDLGELFRERADHTFLVKLSYWLAR